MDSVLDYVIYIIPQEGGWLSDAAGLLAALAATFSTLVAIIALRNTRMQMELQQKHNNLMVTPHLSTKSLASVADKIFSFAITNNGLGPAVISKITVYAFGEIHEGDAGKPVRDNIYRLLGNEAAQVLSGSYTIGEFVPPGDKQIIYEVTGINKDPKLARADFFKDIRLVIEYESIYGAKYKYDSDEIKSHAF